MSNTNKVPSAEEIILKTLGLASFLDRYGVHGNVIEAMKQHTRLHLEAMRDEIVKEEYLDIDINKIIEIADTYINNNKL